jgi:hypothetical protein
MTERDKDKDRQEQGREFNGIKIEANGNGGRKAEGFYSFT